MTAVIERVDVNAPATGNASSSLVCLGCDKCENGFVTNPDGTFPCIYCNWMGTGQPNPITPPKNPS